MGSETVCVGMVGLEWVGGGDIVGGGGRGTVVDQKAHLETPTGSQESHDSSEGG